MAQEITRDQLVKLAQDMVASSHLQVLYGIAPFAKAKAAFEEGLLVYEGQLRRLPTSANGTLTIGERTAIPEFLRFD